MKTVSKVLRSIAIIKLAKPPQAASAQAKTILAGLTDNPSIFVTPVPPLATMKAHIDALDSAETEALTRKKGAAEARNAALAIVMQDLHEARTYVNKVADADPANAAAIITAAGFFVRKPPTRNKQLLAAKQGSVSGTVLLEAKAAGRKAAYGWQWSLDQKVWTDLPQTLVARTSVSGLSTPVAHYFRFRSQIQTGQGDWSDAVTFIVH